MKTIAADLPGDRPFRDLWTANLVSGIGTQVNRTALILYIADQTDSAPALAALVLAETAPGTLFAPIAGTLVDRFDRQRMMIACEVARLTTVVALLAYPSLPTALGVAMAQSVVGALYGPARSSSIPLVVGPESLERANGLDQMTASLVMVTGPMIGAALYLRAGLAGALFLDVATYLASLWLLSGVVIPLPNGVRPPRNPARATAEVLAYLRGDPALLCLVALPWMSLLCVGMWLPLAPGLIRQQLGAPTEVLGLQLGLFGIGEVAGAALAVAPVRRIGGGRLLIVGLALEAAIQVFYAFATSLLLSCAICGFWGVVVAWISVAQLTLLQKNVPPPILGRVFVIQKQGEGLALLGSMGCVVAIRHALAPDRALAAAGLVYAAVVLGASLTRAGRELGELR
jgi:MFS family permease